MKIACFTVAAMDYFPQIKTHHAGGNSLNQAVRMKDMGFETAFIGPLGTDEAGNRIEALIRAREVDTTCLYRTEGETARNQIINDDAGERFGVEGAWEGGVYETWQLAEKDWRYLENFDLWTTHANNINFPETLKRKSPGQYLSVDFLHLTDYDLLKQTLKAGGIAFCGGTPDMANDLAEIARTHSGLVILTLGAEGSIAFHNDNMLKQPALPLDKVADTTGCGDAFQAGFAASYFKTKDIGKSLLAGAEQGKIAAAHYGGIPW